MNRIGALSIATMITGLPLTAEAGVLTEQGDVIKSAPSVEESTTSDISGELSAIKIKTRPCSDFLNAQGKTSRFFNPVPDYVGWTDAVNPNTLLPETFGLVDYAGLADKYIKAKTGKSLGTNVTCLLTEGKLADGSAKITVALVATKALGFAQSVTALADNDFHFLDTPAIFGAKVVTTVPGEKGVVDGADPALGPAALDASFRIAKAGGPLPDLVDVLVDNRCKYAPINYRFGSFTFGKKAVLHIKQEAVPAGPPDCVRLTKEVVEIRPIR